MLLDKLLARAIGVPKELTPLEYVYSEEEIQALVKILQRAKGGGALPIRNLRRRLTEIGLGGSPKASEYDRAFDAAAAYSARPAGRSAAFATIADARTWNGLISAITTAATDDRVLLTQLKQGVRGRRRSSFQRETTLEQIDAISRFGLPSDFSLISNAARRLEIAHRNRVECERPSRGDDISIALTGLAKIFAHETHCGFLDVSHSENSIFIQFALTAIKPHPGFWARVKKATVIARRWERLKGVHAVAMREKL